MGALSTLYIGFTLKKHNTDFVNTYFDSLKWYHEIHMISAEGARNHGLLNIPTEVFFETKHWLPINLDEQEKIAKFFQLLEYRIEIQQKLLDALKLYKRGLLSKLFPQKGESVPQYRFAGFTDVWEQRQFGDLGSVSMCKRIFKEQTSTDGDIPFYKIGTFGSKPDAFITRELFEEYKEKFPYPQIGDMLISASGTIGRIVEYTGENAYFQDSNIVWFKHDDKIDNSFLKCVYAFVKWSGIEGSTIKRLYNDNFLKTEFWMPQIEEQKKIGTYFSILDHLITLHQQKYSNMQSIQKFMLQNMFV